MTHATTSLDTVKVQLTPQDAIKVMIGHNERDEPWGLNCTDIGERSAVLLLNVDGSDTEVAVRLDANGTWTASAHIVLGEKKGS